MADPFGNIPLNVGPAAPAPTPPVQPPAPSTPPPAPAMPPAAPKSSAPIESALAQPVMNVPITQKMAPPVKMPDAPFIPKVAPVEVARVMPRKSGAGPLIGIVIIVVLFVFGGLYFWGAHLNAQEKAPLPLISGDPAQQ